jgi:hypothetical protein
LPSSSLSSDSQRRLIQAKIGPGSILHLPCDYIEEDKYKYVVVAAVDYEYDLLFLFFINSRIRPFISRRPDLLQCQVKLHHTIGEYSFLQHDSFIDCSKLVDELGVDFVVDYVLTNGGDYKGDVRGQEIQAIISAVKSTPTISEDDKELILDALNNC